MVNVRRASAGWWALMLLGLALALRAASLAAYAFDGLYGQDPYAYYDYAVGPLTQALLRWQPFPPFFWPPGYPLLVALAGLIAGRAPAVAQSVALLCGAAVPPLTYLLARALWPLLWPAAGGRRWGQAGPLLAGLATALHPQLWQSSVVVMADAPALAAATLGAWALARYAPAARGHWLLLASGAVAVAVLTRWAYALLALPVTGVALALLLARWRVRRRAALAHALGAALVAGVLLAPLAAPLLTPPAAGQARAFAGDLEVYTWNPANVLRRSFVTADGAQTYRLPNGLYYGLLPLHPYYFTPLLAVFLLPALARLWRAPRSALALGLLGGWPLVILGFHAGAPWQNFRFGLAALPPLAVLVALGAAVAWRWRPGRGWRALVAALILGGLAWQAWGGWALTRWFAERKAGDLALVAAVEAHTPPGARLLTFQVTPTFAHYSRLETHELWALTTADLAALLAGPPPAYLLLDVANAQSQWAGRAPAVNYAYLRDGPGLDRLATYGSYQLFAVRCAACP
ncbi:MAG: hypothetical protein IT317_17990 [Anaerolineales bacterium]|nr:hypothetical protein [Anaerolineales bacterium]